MITVKVWLLHGTWPRQARWTKDNSSLRKALQEGLEGEVSFTTLPWTGKNKRLDRNEAGKQLRSSLDASAGESDMNFIVAHSHGGNIAVDAVAIDAIFTKISGNDDKSCPLDGVVTLNTPFLSFIPHSHSSVLMHLVMLGLCWLLLLPQILSLSVFAEILILVCLAYLGIAIFEIFRGPLVDSLLRLGGASVSTRYVQSPSKILSICTTDDEVFSWLDMVDTILNIPYLVLHKVGLLVTLFGTALVHYLFRWDFLFLEWLAKAVETGKWVSGSNLFFGTPPVVSDDTIHLISTRIYEDPSTFLFAMYFTLSSVGYYFMFWAILAAGSLIVIYLFRAVVFGTGLRPYALLEALFSRLKVSLTPLFHSNVELVIIQNKSSAWLRHSDVYDNPFALKEMLHWMNERIKLRREISGSYSDH